MGAEDRLKSTSPGFPCQPDNGENTKLEWKTMGFQKSVNQMNLQEFRPEIRSTAEFGDKLDRGILCWKSPKHPLLQISPYFTISISFA
jgi:hypothetical protein